MEVGGVKVRMGMTINSRVFHDDTQSAMTRKTT
jgi:hypothetical protein